MFILIVILFWASCDLTRVTRAQKSDISIYCTKKSSPAVGRSSHGKLNISLLPPHQMGMVSQTSSFHCVVLPDVVSLANGPPKCLNSSGGMQNKISPIHRHTETLTLNFIYRPYKRLSLTFPPGPHLRSPGICTCTFRLRCSSFLWFIFRIL